MITESQRMAALAIQRDRANQEIGQFNRIWALVRPADRGAERRRLIARWANAEYRPSDLPRVRLVVGHVIATAFPDPLEAEDIAVLSDFADACSTTLSEVQRWAAKDEQFDARSVPVRWERVSGYPAIPQDKREPMARKPEVTRDHRGLFPAGLPRTHAAEEMDRRWDWMRGMWATMVRQRAVKSAPEPSPEPSSPFALLVTPQAHEIRFWQEARAETQPWRRKR